MKRKLGLEKWLSSQSGKSISGVHRLLNRLGIRDAVGFSAEFKT